MSVPTVSHATPTRQLYDAPTAPASTSDFVELAKDFDLIHLVHVDIHGIPRARVIAADAAESLVSEGVTTELCALTFSTDGLVTNISGDVKTSFDSIRLRPVIETARSWPWLGSQTGARILQVLCEAESLDGDAISVDTRRMALAQLKRLHDRNLDIRIAWELEFRLFKVNADADGDPVPSHECSQADFQPLYGQYEPFYAEVHRRARALGFKVAAFRTGLGPGKLQLALSPEWGVKAVDDLLRLKAVVREMARDCGWRASFMAKVDGGLSVSALHCSHSVWRRTGGEMPSAADNAMLDVNDSDKMSSFARLWMAGLLHHANGLLAVGYPTVNCYRMLCRSPIPSYAYWLVDNCSAAIRVRTNVTTSLDYRSVSSAANPYLVIAGLIATGLDGVDRELPLVDEGSKEMGRLPRTLGKALVAMKQDEVIYAALEEEFIDWYVTVKLEEMTRLESVDVALDKKEDYSKERQMYFDSV